MQLLSGLPTGTVGQMPSDDISGAISIRRTLSESFETWEICMESLAGGASISKRSYGLGYQSIETEKTKDLRK